MVPQVGACWFDGNNPLFLGEAGKSVGRGINRDHGTCTDKSAKAHSQLTKDANSEHDDCLAPPQASTSDSVHDDLT
jgi:hypothetical protein